MKSMKKIISALLCFVLLAVTVVSAIPALVVEVSAATATYKSGYNSVSSSYAGSAFYTKFKNVPITGDGRTDVLAVALSQIGYQESSYAGSYAGTTSGSGNYTEYNYNMGPIGNSYAYYWCATFVSWALLQSGCTTQNSMNDWCRNHTSDKNYIWREVGCGKWADQLRKYGYFKYSAYHGGTYKPQSGDLIFYNWNGNAYAEDHIGIVVYSDSSRVYTVEGNTSDTAGLEDNGDGVYFKSYDLNYSCITGYGVLPYATADVPEIDYSGANPTTGLYMANANKSVYSSATATSATYTMPRYTMFEVTEIASNGRLKVSYSGKTGYIINSSVIQISCTENAYLGECTKYPSYCEIEISENVNARSLPCAASVNSDSLVKKALSAGSAQTATALYKNTAGEYWYQLQVSSGDPIYVSAASTTYKNDLTSDVLIMEASEPVNLASGASFAVRGSITSQYNRIKTVSGAVLSGYNANGSQVIGKSESVDTNSYSLYGSTIDNNMAFGTLANGKYTYVIDVKVENHHATGASTKTVNTHTVRLKQAYFTVGSSTTKAYSTVTGTVTATNAYSENTDGEINYYPNSTTAPLTLSSNTYNFRYVYILVCDASGMVSALGNNLLSTAQEQTAGGQFQNDFTVPAGGFAITFYYNTSDGASNVNLYNFYNAIANNCEYTDSTPANGGIYNETVDLIDNTKYSMSYSNGVVTLKTLINESEIPKVQAPEPQPEPDPEPDPEPQIMLGDVNDDGYIDTRDYVLVARSYMGTYALSDKESARADVNGDDAIDTRDYVLIARHYMGTYTIG